MQNLPNILTIVRLLLLPVIFILFLMGGELASWICLAMYITGAATDWLDGYIARKMNVVSPFGIFLDPIADKIFVSVLLLLLVGFDRLPGIWMAVPAIILMREFLVAGMREYLGPKGIKMPVTKLAKWKTASQMLAIAVLIVGPYIPYGLTSGRTLMLVAMVLTVVTGWKYLREGFRQV
jgi:CDP-diacylglycerol--glycerol-3-phosphate 3-phosphatidyltransferase